MLRSRLRSAERPSLTLRLLTSAWALASALLFGWAALVLPTRPGTVLGGAAGALTFTYALTVLCALLWPRQLRRAWLWSARASLAGAGLFAMGIAWTSVAVVRLYGALGWGLSALLVPIALLLLAATLPYALWGLRAARRSEAT
jgi:hypothetical protein